MRRALSRAAAGAVVFACGAAALRCGGDKFTEAQAPADAAGGDTSAPPDGPISDAPTTGFCDGLTPQPFFCDDWDTGLAESRWDRPIVTPNALEHLDQHLSVSPPRSLLTETIQKNVSSTETLALLVKSFGTVQHKLTNQFQIQVQSYGADLDAGGSDLAFIWNLAFGTTGYSLVAAGPQDVALIETAGIDGGPAPVAHGFPPTLGFGQGQWVPVEVDVTMPTIAAGQAHIKVVVGNAGFTALDSDTFFPPESSTAAMSIGVVIYNAVDYWKINYDNFVVNKE
jgi:hypothetical protein